MIKSLQRPIQALIRSKYLQDMDPKVNGFHSVEIIAFASYPGHVLTAEVLVNGCALFSYVPFMAIAFDKEASELQMDSTYHCNCPNGEFYVHELSLLKDKDVFVFDKGGNFRNSGGRNRYLMTVDWPDNNNSAHLINFNGSLIAWPNHKLLFGSTYPGITGLPQFKKLRKEWKL